VRPWMFFVGGVGDRCSARTVHPINLPVHCSKVHCRPIAALSKHKAVSVHSVKAKEV
jgi:hypothetical protein